MSEESSSRLAKMFAKMAAAAIVSLGVVVLLGWACDIALFKNVFPGLPAMVPNTAAALVLAGLALWLLTVEPVGALRKAIAQAAGLAVALVGALTLGESLFGWRLPLDQLLFRTSAVAAATPVPGRLSLLTAAEFLLFGLALLLLDFRPRAGHWLLDLLIVIPVQISLLALIGYACNVPSFYGWRSLFPNTAMALLTALALTLLGAGLLSARPGRGLMKVLTSATAGGVVARRLLLAPVLIPLFTGLIKIACQRGGYYNAEFAFWFFSFLNIFAFTAVIWWNATLLYQADVVRQRAEDRVHQLNSELEQRVRERTAELEKTAKGLAAEITERERAQDKSTWLASFPEQNPNPIVEFDYERGMVKYANPFANRLFPDLQREGIRHPWLAGLHEAAKALLSGSTEVARREIVIGESCYAQTINYVPETGQLRVYSSDITSRRQAEARVQANLARLELLHRITRATGERQDLASIFQVVIRSLEDHLPIDFGCVCRCDPSLEALTVMCIGSRPLALDLADQARIEIDQNGLSRCVHGQLVYEPDISRVDFPFPQRLAKAGLGALVFAPLLVESKVFGVLVVARTAVQSFSSGECEFLRQLSEHVALAAHQAQLYSALQQAYDDLRQTQQAMMQQERLRALGQMASGIAHDINNAITPVLLYTESLLEKETYLSDRARNYLQTIQHAIGDVAQTVSRMREFYRKREPKLTLSPVSLNLVIQQVVDLSRARWNDIPQQRGVVIKMNMDLTAEPPAIMGAESEIREALINLVFNAVDAMPNGGTLILRTKIAESDGSAARQVLIEVADTGVGMDENTRRRCLEPFFTTKGERGTGLGLSMVYGIVQRHSAEIEIESEPHKGTTVRLSFPVTATVFRDAVHPEATPALPPCRRILLVDDDPLLIKSLRDILETDGHVVVETSGGEAGIEAFHAGQNRNEPFGVVITDLGMPYVDGRQVASAVKEASPSTPVILLTGWGQRLVAEGDIPAHVDHILSKPPKLSALREALARCPPPSQDPKPDISPEASKDLK